MRRDAHPRASARVVHRSRHRVRSRTRARRQSWLYFAPSWCTVAAHVPKARRKQTPSRKSSPARRIGGWVLLLFIAMIVLDALVGDRGLMATLRARRDYHE